MRCEQFRADVDALALGALDAEQSAAMQTHLRGCSACGAEFGSASNVAERLLLGVPQVRAPAGLRDAVLAAIRDETDHLNGVRPEAGAIASASPEPAPLQHSAAGGARKPWLAASFRLPALAAAAVAILLVGLAGWAVSAQLKLRDAEHSRDHARAAAVIAQSAATLSGTGVQQLAALLATPHTVTADLQPQAASEPSDGAVIWSPDKRRCVVLARRLAPLDAGQEYHVWFVSGQKSWDGGAMWPDAAGTAEDIVSMDRWSVEGGYVVNVVAESPQGGSAPRAVLSASLSYSPR
ncbi:MAG: anti-sigma factor [Dehalococcoidia bacterium]